MQIFYVLLSFTFVFVVGGKRPGPYDIGASKLIFKKDPPPNGNRCGVCPTYLQKICAFDFGSNATFIFDNRCVMDMFNCLQATDFQPLNYDHCLYFGNFAYVHGFKQEDEDYGEDHFSVAGSKKNPDFV